MTNILFPIELGIAHVNEAWWSTKLKRKVVEDMYVIGFYQRSKPCKCLIVVLDDKSESSIEKSVVEHISEGNLIYCESGVLPKSISDIYTIVEVGRGEKTTETKDQHINHVNSMWRDLKRNIKDEHIQVSKKHLQLYCDEVAWRINNAHLSAFEKFDMLIKSAAQVGPRKYKDLTKHV